MTLDTDIAANYDPVFIVGMNGSGTTMLLDCLNNHPMLYGFRGETRIIPYFISKTPAYGDLTNDNNFLKLWNDFRNDPIFVACNNGVAPDLPINWRNKERTIGAIIDGVFQFFASQDNKQRWCEKTPMSALHMTKIANVYPQAKFIHMIRDGRDCAVSFNRRWGYSSKRTICRWKEVISKAQQQAKSLSSHYLEVRYEDLTSKPELWMQRICNFLDVEYNEKVLYLSRNQAHSGSKQKRITENKSRWKSYYSDNTLVHLEKIAGKRLHSLGYTTSNPTGDSNPAKIVKAYLALHDLVYAVKNKMELIRKKTKYGFRAQLTAALRQIITNRLPR